MKRGLQYSDDVFNPLNIFEIIDISSDLYVRGQGFPLRFLAHENNNSTIRSLVIVKHNMELRETIGSEEIIIPIFNFDAESEKELCVKIANAQLRLIRAATGDLIEVHSLDQASFVLGNKYSKLTDMLVEPEFMELIPKQTTYPVNKFNNIRFHVVPGISSLDKDKRICIGLDLQYNDSLIMPWRSTHHYVGKICVEIGIACLNTDRVITFEEEGLIEWAKSLNGWKTPEGLRTEDVAREISREELEVIKQTYSKSCTCSSPRCTWQGSFHCMHGVR